VEREGPSKQSILATVPSPQPQAADVRPSPGLQEELEALPKSYGRTTIVLMAVDPYLVHAYWEVAPKELEATKRLWDPQVQSALRFYDVTGIAFDGTNARACFDVDVQLAAENWYVRLWSPGKSYVVDLGLRRADGSFFALVRSNTAHTPPAAPSMNVDVRYLPIQVGSKVQEMSAAEPPVRAPAVAIPPSKILPPEQRQTPGGYRRPAVVDIARTVWKKLVQLYRPLQEEKPDYAPRPPAEDLGALAYTRPPEQPEYSVPGAGIAASAQTAAAPLVAGSAVREPAVAIAPGKLLRQEEGQMPDEHRPPAAIDMARIVWEKLARLYHHFMGEEPGYRLKAAVESSGARPDIPTPQFAAYSASGTETSAQETSPRFVDLTQMDENSFVSGVSSR